MDFNAKCISNTLVFFNLIFLLVGFAIFLFSIWTDQKQWPYLQLSRTANQQFTADPLNIPSLLEDADMILLAGGVTIIFTSILGIVAARRQHRKMLYAYCVLLIFSIMTHLGAGVVATLYKDRFAKQAAAYMDVSHKVRYRGPFYSSNHPFHGDKKFSLAVDYGQVTLRCCGVRNGTDYLYFSLWNRTWEYDRTIFKAKVPFTCCKPLSSDVLDNISPTDVSSLQFNLQDKSCPVSPTSANSYLYSGCYSRLQEIFQRLIAVFVGVVSALVVMEIAAWWIAFRLARFMQITYSDFDLW